MMGNLTYRLRSLVKSKSHEGRAIAVSEFLGKLVNVLFFLAVNFSLMMPDVITEVLSSLFTGKAINEFFTGRKTLMEEAPNSFDVDKYFAIPLGLKVG
jgi:hypothetical protein